MDPDDRGHPLNFYFGQTTKERKISIALCLYKSGRRRAEYGILTTTAADTEQTRRCQLPAYR